MIVFGSTLSPYVRKVMAYCSEKGLAPELRPAGLGRGGPEFAAASPFGKMPALLDGDYGLADSSAIVHYLEARHPEPNLIPAEPRARGRAIWFDEFADTLMMAASGTIFGNRFVRPRFLNMPCDEEAAAKAEREALPPLYDYLEGVVPESGFLVEDRITIADLAVAAPFGTLSCIGVRPDAERWPSLARYLDAIHARPSFAPFLADDHALVEKMGGPARAEAAA